ncbi:MAG: hypothetical protein AAFP68_22840, partial [Pseudomonadota bacterium]
MKAVTHMLRLAVLILLFLTATARADGEKAGDFDYYVMALSWNASWCEREGDERGAFTVAKALEDVIAPDAPVSCRVAARRGALIGY